MLIVTQFLLVLGVPLVMWFGLDMKPEWLQGGSARLIVVQLLSAALVGAVAIDVFLAFQLPRLLKPRVHACFLQGNPDAVGEPENTASVTFFRDYTRNVTVIPDKEQWLHILVTNVGTIHLPDLKLSIVFPEERVIEGLKDISRDAGKPTDFKQRYVWYERRRRVEFYRLDIAPGISAGFSFRVKPLVDRMLKPVSLKLFFESGNSTGITGKRLFLQVRPPSKLECTSTKGEGWKNDGR